MAGGWPYGGPCGGQQALWQLPPEPCPTAMADTTRGASPGADRLVLFGFWPDPVTGRLVPGHFVGPSLDSALTQESSGRLSRPASCAQLDHAGELPGAPFPEVSIGTRSNDWLDYWSPRMGVYTVSVVDDCGRLSNTPFGVLCSAAAAPGYTYCPQPLYLIRFNGSGTDPVRIQMDYHPDIPWGPDMEHVVKAHQYATQRAEVGPTGCVVILQWPADGGLALDGEAMRNGPYPQAPAWLWHVHEQVQRLLMLERVTALIAPVAPMPSPVKLQAALGPDRDGLRMVGHDVLHLLAVVAEATKNPLDDARELMARAVALTDRGRLALMVAKSHILDFAEAPDMGEVHMKALAADVGEALCGSILLELGGSYANVLGFWRWLAADDGIHAPRELHHLDLALRHLGGQTTSYLGRTETYSRLREVPMSDGGSQPPSFALEVSYLSGVVLRYEMVNARAQELQVGVEGAEPQWIKFEREKGALMSPALQAPLPNKVSDWVNRKPFAPLCKIEHHKKKTLQYESLRELRTGKLTVEYIEHGKVEYERSLSGQLGYERRHGNNEGSEPLYYSEKDKAILSFLFPDTVVPNKVADWLRGKLLNLATLPTVRNRDAPTAAEICVEASNEACSWFCPESLVRYWVTGIPAIAGIVYASRRGNEQQWRELVYMEQGKEWRIAPPDGQASQPLPVKVTAWLCTYLDRLDLDTILRETTVQQWVVQQAGAPWVKEPVFVSKLLPKAISGGQAMLEATLRHRFRNRTLLAQALTHPSRHPGLNYQRLAVIGLATVELVVSMRLYEASSQETTTICSAASTPDLPPVHQRGRRPPCIAPLEFQQGPWPSHPPTETPTPLLGTEVTATEQVVAWDSKRAVCNDLAYARSAVALRLHLALQHDSDIVARKVALAEGMRQSGKKLNVPLEAAELGDVFLACVGAVMMDGQGWPLAVKGLVEAHVKLCQADDSDMTADAPTEEVPQLAGPSPAGPGQGGGEQVPDGLADVAQYCSACCKWLNGPAQLQDHKEGKKHRQIVYAMGGNP